MSDERARAVRLFNEVWTLLGKADRTPAENDRLLHMAHASRYFWGEVGTPANLARGKWQCSRVYAVRTSAARPGRPRDDPRSASVLVS